MVQWVRSRRYESHLFNRFYILRRDLYNDEWLLDFEPRFQQCLRMLVMNSQISKLQDKNC